MTSKQMVQSKDLACSPSAMPFVPNQEGFSPTTMVTQDEETTWFLNVIQVRNISHQGIHFNSNCSLGFSAFPKDTSTWTGEDRDQPANLEVSGKFALPPDS